ncbi:MAG TPA: M23 family metallopeptidase [Methylomirabilota bacterium]|nr:M23 family metallopeptidase [Methylomirabilota bacterium]
MRAARILAWLVALAWALASPAEALADPGDVIILSPYKSRMGANRLPRRELHAGVDFAGNMGAPVLAAADGTVQLVMTYATGCGIGVVIAHPSFDRYTAYCHMQLAVVSVGERVRRGHTIGYIGVTGNAVNVPHVHLELCTSPCASHRDGDLGGTADPLSFAAGCYDPSQAYPTDRLVLTFPVQCQGWRAERSH